VVGGWYLLKFVSEPTTAPTTNHFFLGEIMFCPQCGATSPQKTNFCKKCGASMNPAANTVEVHLPRAGVSGMVWAVAAFSMVGLIASLTMLGSLSGPGGGLSDGAVVFAFIGCLMFILSVAGLLTWQLARLINTYRDAVRQTINKAQFEVLPPPPQLQPQPVYIPAAQAADRPSVVEHTTRQMAGVYGEPHE
jgi:hypothetical protein